MSCFLDGSGCLVCVPAEWDLFFGCRLLVEGIAHQLAVAENRLVFCSCE